MIQLFRTKFQFSLFSLSVLEPYFFKPTVPSSAGRNTYTMPAFPAYIRSFSAYLPSFMLPVAIASCFSSFRLFYRKSGCPLGQEYIAASNYLQDHKTIFPRLMNTLQCCLIVTQNRPHVKGKGVIVTLFFV